MIFLIEYERSRGELSSIKEFEDSERLIAEDERLSLELSLHRQGLIREVVLLEAASKKDLLKTHRRYFVDIAELLAAESDRIAE